MSESISLVDGLIDAYEQTEETFDITLPKGDVMKFRHIRSYDELQDLKRGAGAFIKRNLKRKPLPEWEKVMTKDPETLALVFSLSATMISWTPAPEVPTDENPEPKKPEPQPPISQLEWLKFAKKTPWLFEHITDRVNAKSTEAMQANEDSAIELAKND